MGRIAGSVLLFTLLTVSQAFAVAAPVGSLWGGIWHKTNAAGVQVDCLDVGLNDYGITDLSGLTFSVQGPGGFNYQFTDADLYRDALGTPEFYHESAAALPAGTYTFTLDDGNGNISKVTDTHVPAQPLPVVDSATIQLQRGADGSYRFNWAPVNDPRPLYYRLVLTQSDGKELYYSSRKMATSDQPYWRNEFQELYNALQDGVNYRARVEVHDAPSFELVTNRSYSDYLNFTPHAADYDPSRRTVEFAAVYNRHESDGSLATDFSLGLNTFSGVSSVSVSGPAGFTPYTFSLGGDRDPVWPELYKKISGAQPAGLYTFLITLTGGGQQRAYATLAPPVGYPAPDVSTYQVEETAGGSVRFSWGDVDHSGALYYRVFIEDPGTEEYYVSPRVNATYADIAPSNFAGFSNPRWRVEIFDSSSITTQRNRQIGPFLALAVQPAGEQKPYLSGNIAAATNYNGQAATNVWLSASGATPITQMRLEGPSGYSRDIFTPGGYSDFLEPVTPVPGLYRFTAVDGAGKSSVRYNYQPEPHPVAPVDFRTVHVNRETYGWLSLSWAPVASDVPLWYGIEFYPAGDGNGDGALDAPLPMGDYYFTGSSTWIHTGSLPAYPFMFRIFAHDGSNGTTYNNYSRSVMVGYSGPGFDYASLSDADGDGYASNVDADDHNAGVNPFPYPAITSFTIAALSASLSVPVTSFTGNVQVAGYCLTESSSSAACSWKESAPADYTFSSAGAKTLYGFVKGVSGNISAAASAQTVITLPSATLTLSFSGTGAGSVSGGLACSKGGSCPPASFATGTVLTLTPAAGSDSIFTGWSGDCAVSGSVCSVTMSGPRSVSAGFSIMPAVWLTRGGAATDYFGSLAAAYQVAAPGSVIKLKANSFLENLVLDRGIGITVTGGYNAGYLSNVGNRSVLRGTLFVRSGTLVAEAVAVR